MKTRRKKQPTRRKKSTSRKKPTPKPTLTDVVSKALREPDFLNALTNNLEGTLQKYKVELSGEDITKLRRLLTEGVIRDGSEVLQELVKITGPIPPPPWPVFDFAGISPRDK